MPEIAAASLLPAALCCFLESGSKNLNHLVLISLRLARATRASPIAKGL
jgi:hypothetical protein